MNDPLPNIDPPITGPQPADKASTWAIGVAFVSILAAGVAASLANNFGLGALVLGGLLWMAAWTVAMGLAVGSLRNAYSSRTPGDVRKKAWAAIAVSAVSVALVVLYIFAIVIAGQRMAEG